MKSSMFRRLVVAATVTLACLAGSAMAASDYLLELDGIQGSSREFPGAFEIEGFDFEMTGSPKRKVGGGIGTGKANVQDISLVKRLDKASPLLMKACAQGQHIKEAKLTCRKAGKEPTSYYTITLEDVMISSYQVGGSGGGAGGDVETLPTDSFSLNFTKITVEWRFLGEGGQVESIVFTYDLKLNKKV